MALFERLRGVFENLGKLAEFIVVDVQSPIVLTSIAGLGKPFRTARFGRKMRWANGWVR